MSIHVVVGRCYTSIPPYDNRGRSVTQDVRRHLRRDIILDGRFIQSLISGNQGNMIHETAGAKVEGAAVPDTLHSTQQEEAWRAAVLRCLDDAETASGDRPALEP